jgi:hypothetical protein
MFHIARCIELRRSVAYLPNTTGDVQPLPDRALLYGSHTANSSGVHHWTQTMRLPPEAPDARRCAIVKAPATIDFVAFSGNVRWYQRSGCVALSGAGPRWMISMGNEGKPGDTSTIDLKE